jgi:hypothetical protein
MTAKKKKLPKRPSDPNQLAKKIVDISTKQLKKPKEKNKS